jgi:hypothetical protein
MTGYNVRRSCVQKKRSSFDQSFEVRIDECAPTDETFELGDSRVLALVTLRAAKA